MNAKNCLILLVLAIIAAISAAVICRIPPPDSLPPPARELYVQWMDGARKYLGLDEKPNTETNVPPAATAPLANETTNVPPAEATKPKPAPPPPAESAQDNSADDALAMTPAQRKKKYEELTKKAEARRLQVLRENLNKSPEGRKALAAVKAFKELGAKVDELKKKYGETDSRVIAKRGDLLKLKDEVRRTNEAYKKWKEKHPGKLVAPEDDEIYRKIISERQLYSK